MSSVVSCNFTMILGRVCLKELNDRHTPLLWNRFTFLFGAKTAKFSKFQEKNTTSFYLDTLFDEIGKTVSIIHQGASRHKKNLIQNNT